MLVISGLPKYRKNFCTLNYYSKDVNTLCTPYIFVRTTTYTLNVWVSYNCIAKNAA